VIYAGWAHDGWASLGRIIVLDLGNGYWWMAAHLSSINVSVGETVRFNRAIGYAGGSGYYRDYHWTPHVHVGFYKHANLSWGSGGVYGGQSAEPQRTYYFANGGGWYGRFYRHQPLSW
jgi:septal ring factor EnvC (AmiA/AmiB activator)